jgi:tRNA pseudouridine55 synthase
MVPPSALHGLVVVDKPAGITSRDAVNRVQRLLPRGTRIGHTGTLDPLATGVLVLCLGTATRLAEYVQRMPKTYRAGIVLGARSDTDDADGTVTPSPAGTPPTLAELMDQVRTFVGTIEQVPPAFSAAKVTGRRAYSMARRGEDVHLAARAVTVYAIAVHGYTYPQLDVEVRCGRGTYVRSLARDLGQRLGCGGYIASLRRTRVGCFDVAAALPLDADAARVRQSIQPLTLALAELPRRALTQADVVQVRQGQALRLGASDAAADELALFDERQVLIGVGAVDHASRIIRPVKILA